MNWVTHTVLVKSTTGPVRFTSARQPPSVHLSHLRHLASMPWLWGDHPWPRHPTSSGTLIVAETTHPLELISTLAGQPPRGALTTDKGGFMGSLSSQADYWVTQREYAHLLITLGWLSQGQPSTQSTSNRV